ncbi:hypothetical protein V2J09_019470 [Rumex salicifolius]
MIRRRVANRFKIHVDSLCRTRVKRVECSAGAIGMSRKTIKGKQHVSTLACLLRLLLPTLPTLPPYSSPHAPLSPPSNFLFLLPSLSNCFSLLFDPVPFDPVIQRIGLLLTWSRMVSDVPDTTYDEEDASMDERVDESSECANKNKRGRVPKRLLKSERERLKREHLNDLFNDLASALELCEPNNGKACILGETIRLVNDLTSHIKCLREENTTLLSESNYVIMERNELKDENCCLESQIQKIKQEIMERKGQLKPDLNVAPLESWQQGEMDSDVVPQPHILGPLYVIPFGQSLESDITASKAKVASHVKKPHPRYPAPGDSWPSQLLQKQP